LTVDRFSSAEKRRQSSTSVGGRGTSLPECLDFNSDQVYFKELVEPTLIVLPSSIPAMFARSPARPSSWRSLPKSVYLLLPSTSKYLEPFRTHIFVHSAGFISERMSCRAPQWSSVTRPTNTFSLGGAASRATGFPPSATANATAAPAKRIAKPKATIKAGVTQLVTSANQERWLFTLSSGKLGPVLVVRIPTPQL